MALCGGGGGCSGAELTTRWGISKEVSLRITQNTDCWLQQGLSMDASQIHSSLSRVHGSFSLLRVQIHVSAADGVKQECFSISIETKHRK